MPDYRRWQKLGGCFFLTIVTYDRRTLFGDPNLVDLLRWSVAEEFKAYPFKTDAAVVLPDHAHFLWTMPTGDSNYSARIGRIKARFTKALATDDAVSPGRGRQRGYSTIWQPRFFEHTIRDHNDYVEHVKYIHYNPVRHGYVQCPHEWAASSFKKWVAAGRAAVDWCCCCDGREVQVPVFDSIAAGVGE